MSKRHCLDPPQIGLLCDNGIQTWYKCHYYIVGTVQLGAFRVPGCSVYRPRQAPLRKLVCLFFSVDALTTAVPLLGCGFISIWTTPCAMHRVMTLPILALSQAVYRLTTPPESSLPVDIEGLQWLLVKNLLFKLSGWGFRSYLHVRLTMVHMWLCEGLITFCSSTIVECIMQTSCLEHTVASPAVIL